MKHWYCGDGTYRNIGGANHIEITISNEVENLDKVSSMFQNVGIPEPNRYDINPQQRSNGQICHARFTNEQSKELWEYMGEPLPGFDYKWPSDKER